MSAKIIDLDAKRREREEKERASRLDAIERELRQRILQHLEGGGKPLGPPTGKGGS